MISKDSYRLSVFRSNRYLFAQLISGASGKTVLGLSDKKLLTAAETKGKTKTARAEVFGTKFGAEALKRKIKKVVFDRGCYRYHGRIKAFADGARKAGLEF
jgi:large subunit ribosomal protein L18